MFGGRAARVLVALGIVAGVGCGYTTDPAERPLEGVWLGDVALIDGGVAWQLWLEEDGQGNVSGTIRRTDFQRIPTRKETVFPGTVSGTHAFSEIALTLDYGTATGPEVYEGRFRSEHHIRGFISRGTEVRTIGTLELRRVGLGSGVEAFVAGGRE